MTLSQRPLLALDPDRDEARRLLEEELASGDYRLQQSFVERVWQWFLRLLPDEALGGPLPPWATAVVIVLVLLAVLAVVAYATRDRWRTVAGSGRGAGAVLDGVRRSAEEYRAAAHAALDGGDHDTAVLEGYRAIAAGAIERTLIDDRPGSTAHEIAVQLGGVLPEHGMPLLAAAGHFDAVRYGDRGADREQAVQVLDLEESVRGSRPALVADGAGTPAGGAR